MTEAICNQQIAYATSEIIFTHIIGYKLYVALRRRRVLLKSNFQYICLRSRFAYRQASYILTINFNTMKKYIILLLTTFTLLSCNQKSNSNSATGNITRIYALEDYHEDFNQMVDLLLKKHPQPHAFTSKESLDKLIADQYNKITDSTTVGRFIWICEEIVSAIHCGHAVVWANELNNLPKSMVFPMNVRYDGSRLYIMDPKNNAKRLSAGDEILSINGVDVETLRNEIFKHLPSDAYNETGKKENVNYYFRQMCAMFYGLPNSYQVTVKHKDKIEAVNLVQSENLSYTKTFLDNYKNNLCLDTDLESSTARITIRSFGYYKKQMPVFKSFVDSCFQHINESQIENLIIDLRNNGGGDPYCGSYLLQYITDKPFTYFDKSVRWYGKLKKPIQPNPNRFRNKPYILINGSCFSTTGHFCSLVKENNLGIFIGDETGGTYTCNDFSKTYNLDNTDLTLRVPTRIVKTTVSTLTNKHGIIPDHKVVPNIDHYLNNRDTVLNYTLKLIEDKSLVSQQ